MSNHGNMFCLIRWSCFKRFIFRGWNEYEVGFGNLDGNHWLGLAQIHRLTAIEPLELHIYVEEFSGSWQYIIFDEFSISDGSDNYRLQVSESSSGTAVAQSLLFHNGMQFSTYDNDNDIRSDNCAVIYAGAWWYRDCQASNLNGRYFNRDTDLWCNVMTWHRCRTLRRAIMKVR